MPTSLGSTLTISARGDREIVITRLLNAPRDLVFKAMSSCEHLRHWLGPRFLTMTACDMDFRVGGSYRYAHRDSGGVEYWFHGDYREIDPPRRVVQTFEFEMMPGHVAVETMTLEEEDGKTRITIVAEHSSTESRDGMLASGMEAGVRDSYDRLEEYLESGLVSGGCGQ